VARAAGSLAGLSNNNPEYCSVIDDCALVRRLKFSFRIFVAVVFTMAMDTANGERSILDWDEDQVHRWLSSLGFSQYEAKIKGALVSYLPVKTAESRFIHQSIIYPAMHCALWMQRASKAWGLPPWVRDWPSLKPSIRLS